MSEAVERVREIFAGAEGRNFRDGELAEVYRLGGEDPGGVCREILRQITHLRGRVDRSKLEVTALLAQLAAAHLATARPVTLPEFLAAPRAAPAGPAGERLMAGLLLLEEAHDVVPFDERTVSKGLDPLRPPDFTDVAEVFASGTDLLRTAGYYVLDARDSYEALASEPPEQELFPPLPFARVWIETKLPGENKPAPYLRFRDDSERQERDEKYRVLDVLGVGLVEVSRGYIWDVYVALRFPEHGDDFFFLAERFTPAMVEQAEAEGHEAAAEAFRAVRRLTVGGAHLITARNVPHDEVVLPRHQRKRLSAIGRQPARIYYVNLGAAGEHDDRETGREYHVRWLVRGHWRHLDGGNALCTCCQPRRVATWIEPYVKGPVGAPWKGRPVHRVRPG